MKDISASMSCRFHAAANSASMSTLTLLSMVVPIACSPLWACSRGTARRPGPRGMRHRQDQGTRPPLDGLEPDGESLAPDGRQEGRSASRAVGKPRSAEGRRVQAGRDLVRANRSAHPDQHQSWLDGIVRTPRLRVETQPPARPLRQHPAMPVRAHPTLGAHQRPGQELHLIRETARVQQRRRAPDRYRRDARDPPAARARGRASYRTRRTRKHWRPSPLPGTPARRGPRAPRPLPCRRSGHATNAAAHPAPARTPDRSCSAPADRPRAAAAPPCPPARIGRRLADRGGVDQHRHAFAAASDRPARPARCARGRTRRWLRSRSIPAADPAPAPAPALSSRPPASEQQTQPLASRSTCPALSASRPASTSTGPKSFTSTAARRRSCASAWFSSVVLPAPGNRRPRSAGCVRPLRRPSQASEAIGRPPTTVPDTRASFRRSAGKAEDHPPARRSPHACRPRWSRPDDPCAAYRPRPA